MFKMNDKYDKYIKEYEEMNYYDLADELVEPFLTVKQDLAKTIYIHYAKERDKNEQLQNNWNELKEFVEKHIKRWEDEEKRWIEHGFMKFGGEANNKIIFKMVQDKMQELQGDDKN